MNTLLLSLLRFFAKAIIQRHQPYIIGVTGTIGKTTLTSYVAHYLRLIYGEREVAISPYHYNGEYGLPLTIIGAKTGGKNPFLWIAVFAKAIYAYLCPYPKYLVLEYGIDHPGEMEYLLSIVKPDIAILTPIAPNHLEQFGTLENYREAKLLLARSAKRTAIIHESLLPYISGNNILTYGADSGSDAYVVEVDQSIEGLRATLTAKAKNHTLTLPSFGHYQAENVLPLYLSADILDIDESIIADNSHLFTPEGGRSRLLRGKNGSTIIDGSYNGGYESICRGIDSLVPFIPTHRIICFLGDMRELGDHAEDIHTRLGRYIVEKLSGGDVTLFLVGPLMVQYIVPLVNEKMTTKHSLSSRELGKDIAQLLEDEKPTIIYVKGSQNTIFLEEGIKEFLENPEDRDLLCRQSEDWMKKKEEFFRKK